MARPATDLRARVLTAARDAFDARGYDGASLRAIARAAGTTIGMIYYYFPSKDDLWDAVIEDVYAPLLADVARVLAAPGPLRGQLRALALRIAGLTEPDRRVVRFVLRDALVSSTRRQRLFERFSRGHIPLLLQAFTRAQASGEIIATAPVAMLVFSAGAVAVLSQLVLGSVPLPGVPPAPARIDLALALLFDGIGAR